MSAPIQLDQAISARCSASIGQADTNEFGYDAAALLAAADAAMYKIKKARRIPDSPSMASL